MKNNLVLIGILSTVTTIGATIIYHLDRHWQLTLADLIDRLPQLPLILHRQLELDLKDKPLEPQLTLHIRQSRRCTNE